MPDIKEIAKLAGVSVSTVPRLLNEHPYVSEEKRARVLATMNCFRLFSDTIMIRQLIQKSASFEITTLRKSNIKSLIPHL